ncbi:hypothetical protein M436DRAFT_65021 [Aureobasidium namibiae CBS 147.97]|uniref:Uncharacterized protein n=1 Tax=Aureobasidium namibiae CBS 147.97 TaxID=1043004 RepID=A0A074WGP0_9PEZI|nr:uncharacterized protein M436DRAFT_65021 [Aureobasidium namibiae CBS 147.97]KEQ72255.1 hypothetical protein M436DRAFT_65021 [Aureobasidium namibiae CBS 147.97]
MAIKRLQAMRAAAAAAAAAAQTNQPVPLSVPRIALLPSVYDEPSSASTSPRAGPADEQPLILYGDTEMEDAPSNQDNYSHSHTTFSPDAKPFIPPSINAPRRTPASVAADNMAPPTMAPPRRLPPHHKLQSRAPANSVPTAPAVAVPSPTVKTEPPASPSLSTRSYRPAPHTRLGPHVQKATAAAQMQRPAQPAASTPVQNGSPANAQNTLVNLHHTPESDQDTWVKVQEPSKVVASTWVDLRELDVKTGTESTDTDRSSAHVDTKFDTQAPMAVTHGHCSSPKAKPSESDNEVFAASTAAYNSETMTNGTRRFSRNEWIPMLLSMNDSDEGRQLIRAFADHIRAGVDNNQTENSNSNTEQGLSMEFADGQRLPATVPRSTTISEMTKEFAELIQVNESDISVVLKTVPLFAVHALRAQARLSNAANALQILHMSIYSSNEALADLQQYISHLEELLTIELGAEEFARRLESLQSRDNESLFIPEDTPRTRKRSGSASSENGSSPKKSRSNSLASSLSHASSLGRSILDKPKVAQSNALSPDVSPKTSRKPSVAEIATVNDQRATAQELALRSAQPFQQICRAPQAVMLPNVQQPLRTPQAVMLPNVQPSSNFQNRSGLPLTAKSPQDLATAQRPQTQPSTTSTRKDSSQPGGVSKTTRNAPMSSLQNTSSLSKTPSKPLSKPIVRKLPKQPAFSAAQFTFSAEKLLALANKSSPSSTKLSPSAGTAPSSASKAASPASRLPSSVYRPSPSSTKSSPSTNRPRKPSPSSNNPHSAGKPFSVPSSSLRESTSVARKPWRAVKKG